MAEIKINLLPPDLTVSKKEQHRKALIINSSVIILISMIIITLAMLIMSFINNFKLKNIEKQVNNSKDQVASLKDKESFLVVLKTRLNSISNAQKTESSPTKAFNIITTLMPSQMTLLSFVADKSGQISVGGETSNLTSLKKFFNNLTDPAENQGTIASVKVNNLNLNPTGNLKFEVSIILK